MNNVKTWQSVEDLVAEGEKLLRSRPLCHKMRNDLTAAILMHKMHVAGFEVSLENVEQCIRRMRIAVDTGIYPDQLLAQASEERRERLVTNE